MSFWKLNHNNLLSFFKENNIESFEEPQSRLPYINIDADGHDIPLFFAIRDEGEILQMIAYLPFQLKDAEIASTSRMLHMLNKDIDLPGFCLDEEQGLIFYRVVLPCLDAQVQDRLLKVYIDTIRLACDSFSHAIGLIASGSINLNELKRQIKQDNRRNHP